MATETEPKSNPIQSLTESLVRNIGLWESMVAVLLGVGFWQLYSTGQPDFFFPGVDNIVDAFVGVYQDGTFMPAFVGSMRTLLTGYLIAAALGVLIGLAMGVNERLASLLYPYISGLYVAPVAALVPIIILVGGASFWSRVTVVVLFAIFEIIIDTYEGAVTTPKSLLEVTRSFGGGRLFVFRKVILPYDIPYIFTGFRLGIGRSVKGMILAELLLEFTNMGAIIRTSSTRFETATVLAMVLVLMAVGIVLTKVVQYLGRLASPWQQQVEL